MVMSGNDSDNDSDDDGGLFGSIGFMFDTAREKLSKDFSITINLPTCSVEIDQEHNLPRNTNTMDLNILLFTIDDDPGHVQSGQYLWPAAFSLSQHLLHQWPSIVAHFHNQNIPHAVVELGSGVGMCGQFLGKYFYEVEKRRPQSFNMSKIVLTDYDPGCLEVLSDNVKLNSLQDYCHTARVEWGKELTGVFDITRSSVPENHFLVIGSDLLYCSSIVRPLFATVNTLLSTTGSGVNMSQETGMNRSSGGLFILASSFDIGEDVQSEVDACCREMDINQNQLQALDLSGTVKQYRIQYFTKAVEN